MDDTENYRCMYTRVVLNIILCIHTIILVAHACGVKNKEHAHSIYTHVKVIFMYRAIIVFMMFLIMIVFKSKSHPTHACMLCVRTQQFFFFFFIFNDDCLKISRALEFTIKMSLSNSYTDYESIYLATQLSSNSINS